MGEPISVRQLPLDLSAKYSHSKSGHTALEFQLSPSNWGWWNPPLYNDRQRSGHNLITITLSDILAAFGATRGGGIHLSTRSFCRWVSAKIDWAAPRSWKATSGKWIMLCNTPAGWGTRLLSHSVRPHEIRLIGQQRRRLDRCGMVQCLPTAPESDSSLPHLLSLEPPALWTIYRSPRQLRGPSLPLPILYYPHIVLSDFEPRFKLELCRETKTSTKNGKTGMKISKKNGMKTEATSQ